MTGNPGDHLVLAILNHVVDQHGGKVQFLTRQLEIHHPYKQNYWPIRGNISIPNHQQK